MGLVGNIEGISEETAGYLADTFVRMSELHNNKLINKMKANEVYTGTVKFFNISKGYGFIIEDSTDKEYFVHLTDTKAKAPLKKDSRVVFGIEQSKKGLKAVGVEVM